MREFPPNDGEGRVNRASTNPDKTSSEVPVYALAGAIYSLNKNVDLSLGLKFGITKPEPDFAGIAGITVKF